MEVNFYMKLPEPFLTRMRQMLGDEYEAFLNSYDQPAARGLRLNLLKAGRRNCPSHCLGGGVPPDAAMTGNCVPVFTPGMMPGSTIFRSPSAMAVAEIAAPRPGERVLDLCAAPGGKTSHLASLQEMAALLISNEIHPQRARILSRNVERHGHPQCRCAE